MSDRNADVPMIVVGEVGRVKKCRQCQLERPVAEFFKWPFKPATYSQNCRSCELIKCMALKAKHSKRSRCAGNHRTGTAEAIREVRE